MTWPFENDTSAITKKLAKKSVHSERRRNLMVVIAVALAAFLKAIRPPSSGASIVRKKYTNSRALALVYIWPARS